VFALLLGALVAVGAMLRASPATHAQPGSPGAGQAAGLQQQPIGMVRIPDIGAGGADVTFPIVEVQIGVENSTTIGSSSGGAGAGRAQLTEIALTKAVDAASPRLWELAFRGEALPQVEVVLCRVGQDCAFTARGVSDNAYLVYTLNLVFLAGVADGGGLIGGVVAERLTLAVGRITVAGGRPPAGVRPEPPICWDIPTNGACR
jgi:type VI protein secretion system component Hcp